jgi:hypothetical protein
LSDLQKEILGGVICAVVAVILAVVLAIWSPHTHHHPTSTASAISGTSRTHAP